MKLATLKNNTRDGTLVIVDSQLKRAVHAHHIAPTLQAALDNWHTLAPQLQQLSQQLTAGKCADTIAFDATACAAPLPRAYQWADGSAYVNHVELVRKARGVEMPENFWTDPLMYQGGSDSFLGPYDAIAMADENWGIDFESEVAVITDDVPMGVSVQDAGRHIQLITIINDVSLRNLIPNELSKGFGFFHGKPATAFAPIVATPDELGTAWHDHKVHLPLLTHLNRELFGKPNAGIDMTFDFAALIAHAAKTRYLSAGTIIGSGTVSNVDRSQGSSCIAEKRMLELLNEGAVKTPFMQFGDTVRIEMLDANGHSLFGAIEQKVTEYHVKK